MDDNRFPSRHEDVGVSNASREALNRLGDAIAQLGGDTSWILGSLTHAVLAMRPVAAGGSLTEAQKRYLVESGDFTREQLAEAAREVARGSLQLDGAEAFLSYLCDTLSLADTAAYLEWEEEAVRRAVAGGRVYAVEIAGRPRFPSWQFSVPHPNKLLPGLSKIIEVAATRWNWHSMTSLMFTPLSSLIATGRQTPAEWPFRGGSVDAVRSITELTDWR
jgi:hypothetical protein